MFISSAIYIGFMGRGLFVSRSHASYQIYYVCFVALIAFLELGFSLVGIARTKNRGHYYRDIKVINFCIALIALLTTQITILDFTATTNVDKYNAWAGIIIGIVIAMCAVYILVAPKISIVDREHHAFILNQPDKNQLVDMSHTPSSLPLCKSAIYGTYSYNYIVEKDKVEGDIVLGKGFWHKINLPIKILCCLLAEILIFAWLIGKFIYFVRSANFPQKLENKFLDNGFEKFENKNA